MSDETLESGAVELATELTIAWLANPNTRAQASEVPDFLRTMHEAVTALTTNTSSQPQDDAGESFEPAVSVRKSLASRDHLISLIDGKPYKTLRRHLNNHGLSPEEYRSRYNLKPDYPMVAPSYAEHRRELAKKIGLGRKPRPASDAPTTAKPTRRGRKAPEAG
jgi:predicted transcriptional regulator